MVVVKSMTVDGGGRSVREKNENCFVQRKGHLFGGGSF